MILREIRKKKRDEIKDIHQQENHFYFIFFEMMMGASEIFFLKTKTIFKHVIYLQICYKILFLKNIYF